MQKNSPGRQVCLRDTPDPAALYTGKARHLWPQGGREKGRVWEQKVEMKEREKGMSKTELADEREERIRFFFFFYINKTGQQKGKERNK